MFKDSEKQLIDRLSKIGNIESRLTLLSDNTENNLGELVKIEAEIKKIITEKTIGFPWLADAFAQYFELRDLEVAEFLDKKLTPAHTSAERVREIAKEKRILEKEFRITRNFIKYYESLFPWLHDFVGEDIDELIENIKEKEKKEFSEEDPVKFYLTKGEYENLSTVERNQRALDRYWKKNKASWEIGRDYERYVGYLYEKNGYTIYYQGIIEGFEDLGRDLIGKKNDETLIIQCKYWAQHKTIHEKHVCQLYGTTLEYWIKDKREQSIKHEGLFTDLIKRNIVKAVLATSTRLSDTAKEFAEELGIEVKENFPLIKYPCIKCNISKRTGEKIYHLPMDQQYDRTIIEEEKNECYVETVAEAEMSGYRRAWKWRGAKNSL